MVNVIIKVVNDIIVSEKVELDRLSLINFQNNIGLVLLEF